MVNQWLGLLVGMGQTILHLLIWLLIAMLTMIPLERKFVLRSQPVFREGFLQDITYFFLSGVLPAFLLVVIYYVVCGAFRSILPEAWFNWVQGFPSWMRLIAIVIAADFGFYWAHRWAHASSIIWRLHVIHHSRTQMDWLVATRTHPVEIAYLRGLSFIPVFGLGLIDVRSDPQTGLMLVVVFNTLWGFFIHANVNINLRWLERVITTPRFHHWHHANDGPDTANKNYAALLPCFDLVFGTFYLPEREFPRSYGTENPLPDSLWRQLGGSIASGSEPRSERRDAARAFRAG